MAEVKNALEDDKFLWYISYDNVNIPFRVFSQRLKNQGEFGNGTAATGTRSELLGQGLA